MSRVPPVATPVRAVFHPIGVAHCGVLHRDFTMHSEMPSRRCRISLSGFHIMLIYLNTNSSPSGLRRAGKRLTAI